MKIHLGLYIYIYTASYVDPPIVMLSLWKTCIYIVTSKCHVPDLQKLFYELRGLIQRPMITSIWVWACQVYYGRG